MAQVTVVSAEAKQTKSGKTYWMVKDVNGKRFKTWDAQFALSGTHEAQIDVEEYVGNDGQQRKSYVLRKPKAGAAPAAPPQAQAQAPAAGYGAPVAVAQADELCFRTRSASAQIAADLVSRMPGRDSTENKMLFVGWFALVNSLVSGTKPEVDKAATPVPVRQSPVEDDDDEGGGAQEPKDDLPF